MEQLILHLFGDYIFQTDWMANNKTKRWDAAIIHSVIYSLPFFLLNISLTAFAVILFTHLIIDRFRLARYVIFARNWINNPKLKWLSCSSTGYPPTVPQYLSVWLMIIADNTMHLAINYSAIRWL